MPVDPNLKHYRQLQMGDSSRSTVLAKLTTTLLSLWQGHQTLHELGDCNLLEAQEQELHNHENRLLLNESLHV